jgi:hypothetical protein
MAEVFGIAAGVVGFASLSIQLTDSVKKLRDYYQAYDNAPSDVKSLIDALETLRCILDQVSPSTTAIQWNKISAQLLEDCKNWCRGIRDDIHGALDTINAEMLRSPRLGKVKYVFRKTSIDKLLQQLQNSKLDILLCQQIFERYVNFL